MRLDSQVLWSDTKVGIYHTLICEQQNPISPSDSGASYITICLQFLEHHSFHSFYRFQRKQ